MQESFRSKQCKSEASVDFTPSLNHGPSQCCFWERAPLSVLAFQVLPEWSRERLVGLMHINMEGLKKIRGFREVIG